MNKQPGKGFINFVRCKEYPEQDRIKTTFSLAVETTGVAKTYINCCSWDKGFTDLEDGDYIELTSYLPRSFKGLNPATGIEKNYFEILVYEAEVSKRVDKPKATGLVKTKKEPPSNELDPFDTDDAIKEATKEVKGDDQVPLDGLDEIEEK